MNQEKIGKFIALRRKDIGLTQKDVAEKLGVTNRSVSKWETGKCLPDVSLFEPLCNLLDINVNELLAGEKLDKKNLGKNKEVIHYIEYAKKKSKLKFLLLSFLFGIFVIIAILGCYFITNFNKTTMYELHGESENFSYSGGLLIVSNYKNVFSSGKVTANKEEYKDVEIIDITLKSDNRTITGGNKFFDGASLVQEDYGYNEILDNKKIDNIDNWFLEIVYMLDNHLEIEKLDVKNEVITRNNKFLAFKVGQINETDGKESNSSSSKYGDNFEYEIALLKYLEENGYENEDGYIGMTKFIREYKGEKVEYVSVDPFYPKIVYRNKFDDKNYYRIDWLYKFASGALMGSFIVSGCNDGKEYEYSYDIYEDSISCRNGECPGSAWEDARTFLIDFDDIINFNVE